MLEAMACLRCGWLGWCACLCGVGEGRGFGLGALPPLSSRATDGARKRAEQQAASSRHTAHAEWASQAMRKTRPHNLGVVHRSSRSRRSDAALTLFKTRQKAEQHRNWRVEGWRGRFDPSCARVGCHACLVRAHPRQSTNQSTNRSIDAINRSNANLGNASGRRAVD